jgi:hypothetical protein
MSLNTAYATARIADADPAKIFAAAEAAAYVAAAVANAKLPPEDQRGLDCGFAWVSVRPARGKFVNWCRKNNVGSKAYSGGWQFWCSKYTNSQSIGVKEAAAKAFRDVLVANDINADVGSRYD